nr:RNA-directed DNA polymerase, eukaryota, reverse transcriptase zinc-binding domain protein [Tanacetum cinerariifolium]
IERSLLVLLEMKGEHERVNGNLDGRSGLCEDEFRFEEGFEDEKYEGGRLTLLKSVLGSMPIYHMSLFKVPMKALQRMESIRCYFFNGVDQIGKKPMWVKWGKVLASKEKGGLGRGWIQNCLRSFRGSVIVNGSPTREFQFHRGLKQGDPLLYFGMFKGVSIGPSLHLWHLFYADDAVFIGHWNDSNIDTIVQA